MYTCAQWDLTPVFLSVYHVHYDRYNRPVEIHSICIADVISKEAHGVTGQIQGSHHLQKL